MRSISRVGVLLLSLVAGQAWAECGIGDADAVVSDAGQGNFSCANYSKLINEVLTTYVEVPLDVTYVNNNNRREVLKWAVDSSNQPQRQPDKLIGVAGNGSRCVWEYDQGQLDGRDLRLDGNKAFQDLFGCSDTIELVSTAPPPTPVDFAGDGCEVGVVEDGTNTLEGTANAAITFGVDSIGICEVSNGPGGLGQKACVAYCIDRTPDPSTDCGTFSQRGELPYDCRRCEAAKDFPNEQGEPYCAEFINSYCDELGDPTCRNTQQAAETIIPRQVGDTAKASWQEYVGSDCGLITVTLGGRDYSRWVPCQ